MGTSDEAGGEDGPVTLAEVVGVQARVTEDVTTVRRARGRVVGLTRSEAWRRRERARGRPVARVRARGGAGHTLYTGRGLIDYMRSWAAVAERAWLWVWGTVQREWAAWAGGRRRRPAVDGQDRVHGRPPEG